MSQGGPQNESRRRSGAAWCANRPAQVVGPARLAALWGGILRVTQPLAATPP